MLTRVLPVAVVSALLAGLIGTSAAPPAAADPLPATYSASTHGDTLGLSVTGAGLTIGAALGHSATDVDSTAEPRAHAESSNLEAGAIGTRVAVPPAPADPDNTTPPKRPPGASPPITAPPLFSAGAVTGTGSTTWAGDAACVPDGVPIAQSTTSLAGATVGVPGVQILNLGAVQASGSTTLQDGSVVSASSGNLANFSMINGLVGIAVLTNPTLTATSDGTTGTVTANDYGVSVTAAGQTTTLTAGLTRTINLTIPFVATVSLTISVGQVSDTSSGATASGAMTFLSITGSATGPFGVPLSSFDFDILPLTATATGAPGGVECTALDPPVITSPTSGAITGETPTITGTGIPGATVTVTEGGTTIGTAVVAADGTWSLVPATPLAVGGHTIAATQALGDAVSGPSAPVTFTVADQTPPDAPVITSPADGAVTGDNTPTITGTAEPGSTVTVTDETGAVIGTAVADAAGNWSVDSTALADGDHTITAVATDAAGDTSPAPAPVTFTVDTVAPAAPVIASPADGSTIADDTPTVSGTGEPGATVEVTIDGTVIGTTTVAADGTWTVPTTTPLADGPHTVTATQTDAAGNTSPAASNTFTVDATAPDPPVITAPADGSVTGDTTPTVTGTAEPGSTGVVTDQAGNVLGTGVTAPDGTWSFDSPALADGTYTITATATDALGNTSAPSAPVTFTVDTAGPTAPVITGPADGATIGADPPTITGTGEPGATVEVTIDGVVVGTTEVGPDGTWSFVPPDPLGDGDHTVTATQTDPAGNTSPASDPISFTVDSTVAAPVIEAPVSGTSTSDPTPTISGTGEPGSTVTVTDSTGAVLGTALVDAAGAWSFDSTALADGTYTITATQEDPAGNVSPASSPVIFTVDTVAPAAPVITGPADGSTIADNTPTITGTGEPGATVEVTVDGVVVGTTTVAPDGTWSLVVPDALGDGSHTVTATQTDAAGNVSPASDPVTFTVDTTAPDPPVVTSPADGDVTADSTPTITGTGEPGATVEVTIDGTVVGTTTVAPD